MFKIEKLSIFKKKQRQDYKTKKTFIHAVVGNKVSCGGEVREILVQCIGRDQKEGQLSQTVKESGDTDGG